MFVPFIKIYIGLHSSEAGGEPKTFRENLYDTLPRSMKSEVLVRVRDEDPEVQRVRQELVRSKSPTELSQVGTFSFGQVLSI